MENAQKMSTMRVVARWSTYLAASLVAIATYTMVPRVETYLYPVISYFQIDEVKVQPDGSTIISGVMSKNAGRAHCVIQDLNVFATDRINPAKHVIVEVLHPDAGVRHRPAGPQTFGPWRLVAPEPPIGPAVEFRVVHRCHFLWHNEQVLTVMPTSTIFPRNTEVQ
jgi:hypothetical protein